MVVLASVVTCLVIAQLMVIGVRSSVNLWRQYGKLFPKAVLPPLIVGAVGLVLFGIVMFWSSLASISDPDPPRSMARLAMYTGSLFLLFISMVWVTLIRYALTDVKWLKWLADRSSK